MLGAGALGRPRGMIQGGRREERSGWGACVYLWRIHVDIWQNQYNIVKLNKKKKSITVLRPSSYERAQVSHVEGPYGEGEGGKIWENGIETCIISYMKRVTSPGSMHDTGCLGLLYWDDPEGWYGEGGGRRVQDGEHMYTCGRFILIYGKTNTVL